MACLRSFSRRSLSSQWFCSQAASKPLLLLLRHIKEDNEQNPSSSGLLIPRFHNKVSNFEDRSLVKPLVSSGVLLCSSRPLSSSSSSEPEDSFVKLDAFGKVPEEQLAPEKTLEAIENLSFPEDSVQYVISRIHELTGFNWWMSILLTAFLVNVIMSPISMRYQKQAWKLIWLYRGMEKAKRIIRICDPKFLPKYKQWEADLEEKFGVAFMSFQNYFTIDALVYGSFLHGIEDMAKKIPEFENGGILWLTHVSTPEKLYIMPLVAGFTFWFTKEVYGQNVNRSNLSSKMKSLPVFLIGLLAIQASFEYQPVVYFYVIPSRICLSTLVLMLSTKKMGKLRSILGWEEVPLRKVSEKKQEMMMMGRVIRLMREFVYVLKKKD